eukprot:gb/GEZJ01003242.1/.p1 GENE.gb/GEZJ01003242.1/~~gb/GEZJ01003242.1/.p1  ORF type:complete len:200 (-),score=16.51 gb/GEZJ01003242.1/:215-814(-)
MHIMNPFKVGLMLSCVIFVANACSCFPTTLKRDFFSPNTERVIKGKVLFAGGGGSAPDATRFFVIRTEEIYKGCNVPNIVFATSPVQSATCGINLQQGTSYILPLPAGDISSLNLCQFIRKFNTLTNEDIQFLNTRQVCCNGSCKCVNAPLVNCFRQPCSPPEEPPCDEAAKCVDNYCGGCFAEWFTEEGQYACLPSPF